MYLKRYRGITVRDALGRARAELGPDALVLSTRMVSSEGWRGWVGTREVEVTVAANREVSTDRLPAQGSRQRRSADAGAHAVARLCAAGLDRGLADEVVGALTPRERRDGSAHALQRALVDRLTGLTAEPGTARIEMFVGPPGSGKTTTIAKLAAQARALHGTRLGLVAADCVRVGAVEQLRLYAEIIGTTFEVARSVDELRAVVSRTHLPLLVDTAGHSRPDDPAYELLACLTDRPDVRAHLVLPASTSPSVADQLLERYAAGRPDCVVITKTDETDSLVPLLGVLHRHRLPISYLGTGQRVPDDLQDATAERLAADVLGDVPHEMPQREGKLA